MTLMISLKMRTMTVTEDYVTLDIGEEEGTEAKEESTETSKEE